MTSKNNLPNRHHRELVRLIILSIFGALIFVSKIAFEGIPNVHPVGMLIMVITITYRAWALLPIYLYVLFFGMFYGFQMWWYPHLYVWLILWAVTMLLPRNMSEKTAMIVYPVVCGLHGLSYGVLWSFSNGILLNYNIHQTLAWLASGFYMDVIHALGNFAMGFLILPLVKIVKRESAKLGL